MNNLFPSTSNFLDLLNEHGYVVYEFGSDNNITQCYHRKDFYKVSLISGKGIIKCVQTKLGINGCVLVIAPPTASISWEIISDNHSSYTCIFTQAFLAGNQEFELLQDDTLFIQHKQSIFTLDISSRRFIATIFQRMLVDQYTFYPFKNDLIRSQINLLIHQALKSQPATMSSAAKKDQPIAATSFVELLERQFPVAGQIVFWN